MSDDAWFHFRWMLNNFYVWPVRWQGWALIAFAALCAYGAVVVFPLWPLPRPAFWIAAVLLIALFIWTAIRHAKAHYPDERR